MENVTLRGYQIDGPTGGDYEAVRAFLVKLGYCEFTYARWDWMAAQTAPAPQVLAPIGLWEQDGQIVGAALFDCAPGRAYLLTLPGFEALRPEQMSYAQEHLAVPGSREQFGVFVPARDTDFAALAAAAGLRETSLQESDLAFYPRRTAMEYTLPQGYSITDLSVTPDWLGYGRVLWKGFNHEQNSEGTFEQSGMTEESCRLLLQRPHSDLSLKVAVTGPDGQFAAFCGMWYDADAGFAVVEPVATVPECRGLGLGRSVVLEGIRRVYARGATRVVVGSSQQFYHAIGFKKWAGATLWQKPTESAIER